MRKTLIERVMTRLLEEYAISNAAGLGAFVRRESEFTTAYVYDTNLLIDYLLYGDEFIDSPHGFEGRELSYRSETRKVAKERILKGFIEIKTPGEDTGPCYDAAVVSLAAGPGFGKEIYGLGYAMSPNGLLAPDRTTVSGEATASWRNVAEKGRKRHKFDDWKLKVTPPTDDDCKVHNDPEKEHLNYAYEAEGWEKGLLRYLEAQHEATMEELSDIPNARREVEGLIASVAIGEFWQKHYWKR
jgi:hypothetical protein